jgi:hypothetical protein
MGKFSPERSHHKILSASPHLGAGRPGYLVALMMNAYSHVVPELQQEAASRMQQILER